MKINESIEDNTSLEEENKQPLNILKPLRREVVDSFTRKKKLQYYDEGDLRLEEDNRQLLKCYTLGNRRAIDTLLRKF